MANCKICGKPVVAANVFHSACWEHEAEKDGRLVVLPCKVGDTVFGIVRYGRHSPFVVEGKVKEMYFAEEDMRLCIVVRGSCRGEWGKVIFGTREEAERALAQQ